MSNRSIKWVIWLGVLAIMAIVAGQGYFFYKAFDLRERQIVQSFRISLQAVAENISEYNKSTLPDNIIHQYSPDYFIVDINNLIDPWVLEHYLRSELNRRHLDVDFEYAIYDCNDDRMVYGNYVSLSEKEEVKNKLEYWPKYDQGLYYFGVHFPGMRNYILGEMRMWYFFSAILVMVIVFFAFAMMIILRQKRLSEVQRNFINNISHEFRTPLTSIGLATDVLHEEGSGGDAIRFNKYASLLKEQVDLLQQKVDKILQQAETEHKFFKLSRERLSLSQIVEEVADELKPLADHRKGRIIVDVSARETDVCADKYHLTGLMINLIDNSIKYSKEEPLIHIRLLEKSGKLVLVIEDNGLGIDKRYIRKVFMPFFRVPSGNIHNVKGSGLGLSYVKKICDLHRWKLRVDSEPGKGTIISIVIPKLNNHGKKKQDIVC